MRHLSVPSADTQAVIEALGGLAGGRVLAAEDENRRLIPLGEADAPAAWADCPVVEVAPPAAEPRSYKDRLTDYLPESVVASIAWPTGHESIGDLILIKLEDEMKPYGAAIGQALIDQHQRVRAVYEDRGVKGEFRVRDLELLALREGCEAGTRTRVRESGHQFWTDPAEVYYSARLGTERAGTLDCAARLQAKLGRPLAICDPYAGVGPSLMPLLATAGLVGDLFAGDLNPAAVALLAENVNHPEAVLEVADARSLASREELQGRFDLLLVNIPHDTLAHLPQLLPLLREPSEEAPVVVRGWAVVAHDAFDDAQRRLHELLGAECVLESRRSYAADTDLCRFEAWLT